MKSARLLPILVALVFLSHGLKAATYYVNASNSTPLPPYTDWSTAATNIQDAITLTTNGDTVLVTNGVYAFGGAAVTGGLTNRIALTNAITVQSVNGPRATTILGAGMTNGNSAVRCAWLTNGATLIGFTLMGGATRTSGDTYALQSGGGVWCASSNAAVQNCVLASNNASQYGGAVYQGTLRSCWISKNTNNYPNGGASYKSVLNNCTIVSNGLYGVVSPVAMTNCLIYFNGLPNPLNYSGGNGASHCCTTPALSGTGNFITAPALFADGVHLTSGSPCIGTGVNIGGGTDIFGNTYSNTPAIGCAEWTPLPLVTTPQIKLSGDPVGFSVGNFSYGGSEPCTFNWLKDGALLFDNGHFSGSSTTNLVITGVNPTDAGNYQVVVSNSFGAITSSVVTLVEHFVNAAGNNPAAPYGTWTAAATNLQDAITAAVAGDLVFVTNGLYASGGKSMDGVITNRVSVDKAILVQSINGASATVIQGAWDGPTNNGPGAVRCVWMTNNAILNGFTLSGGATRTVSVFIPNTTTYGGGVFATSNNAVVCNSLLISNFAYYYGGGAYSATLIGCTLSGNHAVGTGIAAMSAGGGAKSCNLKNCLVTGNFSDSGNGGGADNCNLKNCALVKNSSWQNGAAANGGSLINCTVTSNTASGFSSGYGAAVYGAVLTNCIIIGNFSRTAYPNTNYASSTLAYCCADPLPSGAGNVDTNPQLIADGFHLLQTSPSIGLGTTNGVSGTDIDGQPWNNPPAIGCDEWNPAPVISMQPNFQIGPSLHDLTGNVTIVGITPQACFWSKNGIPIQDDGHYVNSSTTGLVVKNFGPDDTGLYQVVITNAAGTVTSVVAPLVIHAVNAAGANPMAPYLSWDNAATTIQDAINIAAPGDFVLVTNGIYATGGMVVAGNLTNRVVLNKALTVISVNGYQATIIQGAWDPVATNGLGAVRCVWVGDGAVLNGFTLQNGATRATGDGYAGGPLESGGGVWGDSANATVSNCLLTNNSAVYGGAAAYGRLANSLLVGNFATSYGGAAFSVDLNNCTVVNNYTTHLYYGAGTCSGTVRNSIVDGNYDLPNYTIDNYYNVGIQYTYYYSCSSQTRAALLTSTGNIIASPQFLDYYHIPTTSPCYGKGNPAYASGFDLDGQPWNNPPSIGCSEIILTNLVGPLSVSCTANQTNLLVNRPDGFWATIQGRAAFATWSFGDGLIYTNYGGGSGHLWTNSGDYSVTVTVYNNDNPAGVTNSVLVHVQPVVAAQLQPLTLQTNGFGFQFAGQNQAIYTIQYATNLTAPITWQTLQTINFNNQSTIQISDPATTNSVRFYRVLAQ